MAAVQEVVLKALARFAAVALATLLVAGAPLGAQTLTSGGLTGTVAAQGAPAGPLSEVLVTLTNPAGGFARTVVTDGAGRFVFVVLPIGAYDVRVERLGYRPVVLRGVPVEAGVQQRVRVALMAEQPPVTLVDTMVFDRGAAAASSARASWSRWFDLPEAADPLHSLGVLPVTAGAAPRGLELEGLPSRWSGVAVDGSLFGLGPSPRMDRPDLDAFGFPLWAFDAAELDGFRTDVEWPGFGGGLLRGYAAGGPGRVQPRAYAMFGGSGFDVGAVLGTPLVRDTAGLVVGVFATRRRPELDAPWRPDTGALRLDTLARDSFTTDLSRYLQPYEETLDLVSAFARFDWQVAKGHSLSLWSSGARLEAEDLALGAEAPVGLGTAVEARQVQAAAVLTSRISARFAADVRFGLSSSDWEIRGPALAGATFVEEGVSAGSPAAAPGQYQRVGVQGGATLYVRLGANLLRAGFQASRTIHEDDLDEGRAGAFAFGSAEQLRQRRGGYSQVIGSLAAANFDVDRFAWILGTTWQPAPGLELSGALRIERERFPVGEARLAEEWRRLTGLDNTLLAQSGFRVNPRLAMRWQGAERRWALRVEAGRWAEPRDAAVFDEWIAYDGGVQMRRGLGDLGGWPAGPDSARAPVTGPVLTLVNPELESPRTGRVSIGIDRAIARHLSLHLSGTYRHTDYLARRTDLNRVPNRVATDQDGRPVYGDLVQQAALLLPRPGSNRRFGDFDLVSALDPTGYSDYVGVTVAVERAAERGINLRASYTWSRARDNVPGLAGGAAADQLSPFPDSASDWREGRSDLDVPHRAALALEWRSGGRAGVRLGAVLRWRSGYPFTPGFRRGVDVNGDGSDGNDPAFITDTLPGAADVVGRWRCLEDGVGAFAERNACRAPSVASLDLRVAVRLFDVGGFPAELVVDGLNLVRSDEGIVDRALWLVDPNGTVTAPASGQVRVPYVINPDFGTVRVRRAAPAAVRAGLRFNF